MFKLLESENSHHKKEKEESEERLGKQVSRSIVDIRRVARLGTGETVALSLFSCQGAGHQGRLGKIRLDSVALFFITFLLEEKESRAVIDAARGCVFVGGDSST